MRCPPSLRRPSSSRTRPARLRRAGANWTSLAALLAALVGCVTPSTAGGPARPGARVLLLESPEGLTLLRARAEPVTHQGRRGLRLQSLDQDGPTDVLLAIVEGMEFRDGEIELEVAGAPLPDAPPDSRGFIGLSFRVSPDGSRSEDLYLRPTNGRAEDQLRRNHAVQYQSIPGYGWKRLRDETPGQYETYVDLQPGTWTRMRVNVTGNRAELYVNGAEQPTLIVRDLKHGTTPGSVALWAHRTTEAYFRHLVVTAR